MQHRDPLLKGLKLDKSKAQAEVEAVLRQAAILHYLKNMDLPPVNFKSILLFALRDSRVETEISKGS
jgi:hypothetical protein